MIESVEQNFRLCATHEAHFVGKYAFIRFFEQMQNDRGLNSEVVAWRKGGSMNFERI